MYCVDATFGPNKYHQMYYKHLQIVLHMNSTHQTKINIFAHYIGDNMTGLAAALLCAGCGMVRVIFGVLCKMLGCATFD